MALTTINIEQLPLFLENNHIRPHQTGKASINGLAFKDISNCCSLSNKNHFSLFLNRIWTLFRTQNWVNDKHIGLSLTYEYFWIQSSLINAAIADDFSHKDDTLAQLKLMLKVFQEIICQSKNSKDSLNGIFPLQDSEKHLIGHAYAAFFLSNIHKMKLAYLDKNSKDWFKRKLLNVDEIQDAASRTLAKMEQFSKRNSYLSGSSKEVALRITEVKSKDLKDFLWTSKFGNLVLLNRTLETLEEKNFTDSQLKKQVKKAKRKIIKGKKYFADEKQEKRLGLFNERITNFGVDKIEELARQKISFEKDKSALHITISRD